MKRTMLAKTRCWHLATLANTPPPAAQTFGLNLEKCLHIVHTLNMLDPLYGPHFDGKLSVYMRA